MHQQGMRRAQHEICSGLKQGHTENAWIGLIGLLIYSTDSGPEVD